MKDKFTVTGSKSVNLGAEESCPARVQFVFTIKIIFKKADKNLTPLCVS